MLAWKTGENNACFEGLSFIRYRLFYFSNWRNEKAKNKTLNTT